VNVSLNEIRISVKTKRAVVLCSGGLDSTVAAAEARAAGFELYVLSVNYGQRHLLELKAVPEIAKALGAKDSLVIDLNLRAIGGSALTADIPVAKDQPDGDIGGHIPATYVPARNTIFLSLALGWAEVIEADAIYLGANVLDYSGYPDCRPEFLEAFNRLALVGTKAGATGHPIHIEAPLLKMSKAQIIQRGIELQAPLQFTHSCYDPEDSGRSCGRCDSCRLRMKGFAEAGVPDPAVYVV
jgi:7-cyano-7-deazaguanine synthase